MRSIKADWESYLKYVVPAGAGEEQIKSTERAFYAGVLSLFATVLHGTMQEQENIVVELCEYYRQTLMDAVVDKILKTKES